MENEYKIKGKDFVPMIGAMNCIRRYAKGVENTNNLRKYIMKGTTEIMGLLFYNAALTIVALEGFIVTLKGLEKLVK